MQFPKIIQILIKLKTIQIQKKKNTTLILFNVTANSSKNPSTLVNSFLNHLHNHSVDWNNSGYKK